METNKYKNCTIGTKIDLVYWGKIYDLDEENYKKMCWRAWNNLNKGREYHKEAWFLKKLTQVQNYGATCKE